MREYMSKHKKIIFILAAAALILIGFFIWQVRSQEKAQSAVTTLNAEDLPEDFLDNLESVKPEIDGFHFDEETGEEAAPGAEEKPLFIGS